MRRMILLIVAVAAVVASLMTRIVGQAFAAKHSSKFSWRRVEWRTSHQVLLKARGLGGQLELLEDRVRITRRSVFGLLSSGLLKGSEEIPLLGVVAPELTFGLLRSSEEILISQISAIEFKRADRRFYGYIRFAVLEGDEADRGVRQPQRRGTDRATHIITFLPRHQKDFDAIKEELDHRMAVAQR